jgi:acyl-CoA synthetase (AMP-forming)/AMP-acid ligase II
MDTLADLVAATRDREGVAFDAPDRTTPYSAREFATNAWKAGNLLRHDGVREGARVAVVVGPGEPGPEDEPGYLGATPAPLLAALGATLLGATVDLDPGETVEATALIAPAAWTERYETAPGTARLAYGDDPDDPAIAPFERDLWSENPVAPPESVTPDQPAIVAGDGTRTHADLLAAAEAVVADAGLDASDRVSVDVPLSPAVFVAAVLAPLVAGATIVAGAEADADATLRVGAAGEIE